MAEEVCLKVTLHCIGVCVISKEVGPCMIMMESINPGGLYCVSLTRETSDFVSPLYEHTLLIARQPLPSSSSLTSDGNVMLSSFMGETFCVVRERCGCRYRLDAQYQHKELVKQLTTLIGRTLFLDIDCSYSGSSSVETRRLLNPLFSSDKRSLTEYAYWDCTEPQDCALLKKYVDLYVNLSNTRSSGRSKKSLYERFWDAVALMPGQKILLEEAVKQLMAFTKTDVLYMKANVIALFKAWKRYKAIGSFFTHRFTSLTQSVILHKAFFSEPTLQDKLWLMSCEKRIDLYAFYSVVSKTPEKVIVNHSLFDHELRGTLYSLLRHAGVAEQYKYPLLTQCVMQRLEKHSLERSSQNKATLDGHTLASLYTAYQYFTTTTQQPLAADFVLNLEGGEASDSDSEDTVCLESWTSDTSDFGHFIVYLQKHIVESRFKHWLVKKQKTPLVKPKSALFFIAPRPELLAIDEANARHYETYLHGHALIDVKFNLQEPVHPVSWQQDWLNLKETAPDKQQYQFVLFTPLEVMRNEDLGCLLSMFMADIFNTSILRESSDKFFLQRLSHYVKDNQSDISVSLFHKNHCYSTAHFDTIASDAVKETVIVPQCHTFSLQGMQNLLKWCLFHQETVKRVVFIGSPFILPCMSYGQAFLDLIRIATPEKIGPHLYQSETRADEFSTIIKKYWRAPKNTSLEQENLLRQGGCHVLFLMKNEAAFIQALGDNSKAPVIQIYCLTGLPGNVNEKSSTTTTPFVAAIEETMSAKEKSQFGLKSLALDYLSLYNCLPAIAASDVFVIAKKTLLALDKNHLLYLFMLLKKLYVIESKDEKPSKGDFLVTLCDNFRERKKPNQRYSYIAIDK